MQAERGASSGETMIGHILVCGLEFQGRHGATAAERRSARRFQVDVDIAADLERAATSDRLLETIDYDEVCGLISSIGTEHTFRLLEALAQAILQAIVTRWPGVAVTVEVRKLNPPCPGNPHHTAVRLSHGL